MCLIVCFVTGLYSHYLQEPAGWMSFPTRPTWLYRLSQGTHIAAGIAAIPLLLAKLWTVYPRLFAWPIARSVGSLLERASIALFVSSSLLQLFMGLLNTMQWYPWPFYFRQTHFFLAWVMIGSLLIHIAVKLPLIAEHWRRARSGAPTDETTEAADGTPHAASGNWSRRGFFAAIGLTVATVTVTTVGQSFTLLRGFNLFAPRIASEGPQGLAVNRTAAEAGVTQTANSPQWRLELVGARTVTLTLDDLNAMPQTEAELPIACVEGWSTNAHWGGVRVRDLLKLIDAPPRSALLIVSLEQYGPFAQTEMGPEFAEDDKTLLALRLGGEVLDMSTGTRPGSSRRPDPECCRPSGSGGWRYVDEDRSRTADLHRPGRRRNRGVRPVRLLPHRVAHRGGQVADPGGGATRRGVGTAAALGVGALLWRGGRRVPGAVRGVLAGGLVVASVISLVAAPAIWREGEAGNPTILTQQYGHNLAWLLGIGVVTALLAAAAGVRRRGRRNKLVETPNVPVDELDRNAEIWRPKIAALSSS